MDKTGFLKELKRYLAVLNEGEQKDILDEYAQHIDMKMERGMSESEAIREFGDIEELASEILEAYHVDPRYGTKKHGKFKGTEEIPVADIAETGRKFWSGAGGWVKKIWKKVTGGLAGLWRAAGKPFQALKEMWKNRKNHAESRGQAGGSVQYPENVAYGIVRRKRMLGAIPGMLTRGIRKLFFIACDLAIWCIRWAWNLAMMFAALMTGFMMLFGMFGLGVLAVLLMQGYPLAGFMLGCLGIVLCAGSLTAIALCLCRFRGKDAGAQDIGRPGDARGDNRGNEVVYETSDQEAIIAEEVPEHA